MVYRDTRGLLGVLEEVELLDCRPHASINVLGDAIRRELRKDLRSQL